MLSHSFASIYSLCPPFSRSPPPHRSRRCRSTFFELRIQSRFEHVVSAFSPLVLPARMFFFFFVFYLFFLLLLRRWWPRVYSFALGGEERFRRIIGAGDFWQDRPNCFPDRSVTAFPFRCLVTEEEVIFFFRRSCLLVLLWLILNGFSRNKGSTLGIGRNLADFLGGILFS